MADEKKTLYAVAIEVRRIIGRSRSGKGFRYSSWKGDIRYLHAIDVNEAHVMFTAAHSQEILGNVMRIASIGRVIGYFVNDNKGEQLSV